MKTFFSFVNKEVRHILRDRRTMLILFGMPLVMMLLFGFAISTDVRNVRLVVVTTPWDNAAQQIVERLDASEYFVHTYNAPTVEKAKQLIRDQKADLVVVFSPRFADHRYDGGARIQLITDGTDPYMSSLQAAYASQIIVQALQQGSQVSIGSTPIVTTRLLYNPQMKSSYNFVPGIIGMLLLLICAMMTSVSIAREKERGTMEVLLVSPARPLLMLIAKAVPYCHLRHHLRHLTFRFGRTAFGQPVRHFRPLPALHLPSLVHRFAHQRVGQYPIASPAHIGYGDVDAQHPAIGHDISHRKHATSTAMANMYHSHTMVHCRHSQANDYGRGARYGDKRTAHTLRNGSVDTRYSIEEV